MRIDSASPETARAIGRLVDRLESAGARFHPGLRITCVDGEISVSATSASDPWLMRIPLATLVPVDDITWADAPPLRIIDVSGLTPLQRELLDACVDVLREAGTWERFRATHPRATITDPIAIDLIRALHPTFSASDSAAAMLKSRTIHMTLDDGDPDSYLMPGLDLVNHHPRADAYITEDGFLSIETMQTSPDGECFVSYGSTRDVLGIALAYGYIDPNITRVNALSGQQSLPHRLTLTVKRASRHSVEREDDALTITGAAWDAADPSVERTTIIEPIEQFLVEHGTPPMGARHIARQTSRRIASNDDLRLRASSAHLEAFAGTELVCAAIDEQRTRLTNAVSA